jgi:sec-independent protein translocase protein TatB
MILLGPERLPYYASQLAKLTKTVRNMADGAKGRMREEMGPEFDEVDWKKLDPRQYDPRRIIREALVEDESAPTLGEAADKVVIKPPVESAYAQRRISLAKGEAAPFDSEAT